MEYLPNFCFGVLTLINLLFGFGLLEYNTEHPHFLIGASGFLCLINCIICLGLTIGY